MYSLVHSAPFATHCAHCVLLVNVRRNGDPNVQHTFSVTACRRHRTFFVRQASHATFCFLDTPTGPGAVWCAVELVPCTSSGVVSGAIKLEVASFGFEREP